MNFLSELQNEINSVPVKKVLKLLFVSTHIDQTTGYAKVSYGLVSELAKHDWLSVTHYAIQGLPKKINNRIYPSNIKVINACQIEKDITKSGGFAFSELPGVIQKEKPDIVFIYNDILTILQYVHEIRLSGIKRAFQVWAYLDIVYPAIGSSYIDVLNRDIDRIFCFTKEWKNILKMQNITRPIDVMTHAFDERLFTSVTRADARRISKIPEEAFVFLSLNRNQPRKRLDILIMAFVELIVKYPAKPIFLLCICDKGDKGGYPLFDIFGRELELHGANVNQFSNRLILSSSDMCYSDEDMNIFYNIADCGVSCTEGEGFGLCSFEHMGLGIPQVLSNVVGHREYCTDKNSILVEPRIRVYQSTSIFPTGGELFLCDYKDIAKGMEQYLLDSKLRTEHGELAKKIVREYTWKSATKVFMKRLQDYLSEELSSS
jgi:glycosyltransferase involved in cell wall biosynthesis